MRVLALEPYYGGSHRAFLDRWIAGSRHRFTLLTLPPYKWKWRMRHGAVTLAGEAADRLAAGNAWDLLFCSDMLNLAEFRGLAPPPVRDLPAVAYFHENQLTYPVQVEKERDLQFAITNLTTALAADEVWFNSAYHQDELLAAIPAFLKRMPDFQPYEALEKIRGRSRVRPPGIEPMGTPAVRRAGPLRILWAARWEFDKDPETFFRALERLAGDGVEFRLSVVGESFRRVPEVFAAARERFAHHIDRWGYQESRSEYLRALSEADVLVSTARHEFFGLAAVEAIAAGCYPLLPRRLSYPELLAGVPEDRQRDFFYDGSVEELASRLAELSAAKAAGNLWDGDPHLAVRAVAAFSWDRLGPRLDDAVAAVSCHPPPPRDTLPR
jgi:glycosyltransferase involved in cell wall biosynthesis